MKVYTILVVAMLIASLSSAQSVGIGTTTPAPSAALEIQSTTGALLLPRMSTAARNALAPLVGYSATLCQVRTSEKHRNQVY